MGADRFDYLGRTLSRLLSRRNLAGALGLTALTWPELSVAKRKKRKKRKKIKRNRFGCVNVGNFCKANDQCCSGICEGNKCQAHDANSCQAGATFTECGGPVDVKCVSSRGPIGTCVTTTGNAGYCTQDAVCAVCQTDVDCQATCGPQAACLPCVDACAETGGTACASIDEGGCFT